MDFSKEELIQKHAPIKSGLLNERPIPPSIGTLYYPHKVSNFGITLLQHVSVATFSPATPQRRSLSCRSLRAPQVRKKPGQDAVPSGSGSQDPPQNGIGAEFDYRGKRPFSSSSVLTPQHWTG